MMDDDQLFCVHWTDHQSTLIQNFEIRNGGDMLVDCTLSAAEGKCIKAHRVVLSACSPYFRALLNEHYDKHPIFILKDIKFKELKAIMDYMYRGKVNILKNQLTAFVNAAESLQIKGLLESIKHAMNKSLSNVSKIVSHLRLSSINISNVPPELTIKLIRSSERESFINDLSEDLYGSRMSKKHFSAENLHYPISNKRTKFIKASSSEEDTSVEEYYKEFNSNDIPEQMIVPIATVTPVTEEKTNNDPTDKSDSMIQQTKQPTKLLDIPIENPELSNNDIEQNSECWKDQQGNVKDLLVVNDFVKCK